MRYVLLLMLIVLTGLTERAAYGQISRDADGTVRGPGGDVIKWSCSPPSILEPFEVDATVYGAPACPSGSVATMWTCLPSKLFPKNERDIVNKSEGQPNCGKNFTALRSTQFDPRRGAQFDDQREKPPNAPLKMNFKSLRNGAETCSNVSSPGGLGVGLQYVYARQNICSLGVSGLFSIPKPYTPLHTLEGPDLTHSYRKMAIESADGAQNVEYGLIDAS